MTCGFKSSRLGLSKGLLLALGNAHSSAQARSVAGLASAILLCALAGAGCGRHPPAGALVLTQTPVAVRDPDAASGALDVRYPPGSRVVLALPPFGPANVRVLSRGLLAAGGPVVSHDARRVVFAGKADATSHWQIYEARLTGGRPRVVTAMEGGAMEPALLPTGEVVFSSPVPVLLAVRRTEADSSSPNVGDSTLLINAGLRPAVSAGDVNSAASAAFRAHSEGVETASSPRAGLATGLKPGVNETSRVGPSNASTSGNELRMPQGVALYAKLAGGRPKRLTFGSASAFDPTVLTDGRILFVSAQPRARTHDAADRSLFTINNDGTELTAFACQHEGDGLVRRPRELFDGRVGFLAMDSHALANHARAEAVRLARPHASRGPLFAFALQRCRSVEAAGDGTFLVCAEASGFVGRSRRGSDAVFRLARDARSLGEPLFDDPAWNDIEATALAPRPKPKGHLSTMQADKRMGTILCLDANRSSDRSAGGNDNAVAERVRVLAGLEDGESTCLGEVPVQSDGSFLAEVPADVPLGFETLDAQGRVLRHVPPTIWVRPGENRTCIGCHEPHNRSPRNHRPLAVNLPAVRLGERFQTTGFPNGIAGAADTRTASASVSSSLPQPEAAGRRASSPAEAPKAGSAVESASVLERVSPLPAGTPAVRSESAADTIAARDSARSPSP